MSDGRSARSVWGPGVYYETRGATYAAPPAMCTGVPVFVGFAEGARQAGRQAALICRLDRWAQFDQMFRPAPGGYLRYAVRGFFENGGNLCFVLAVQAAEQADARLAEALTHPFKDGGLLDGLEDIDLVCVPDAMLPAIAAERAVVCGIQSAVLKHCSRMSDRFAILDAFPLEREAPDNDPAQADALVSDVLLHWGALPREHGALYLPWIAVKPFPAGVFDRRRQEYVPPCGHIAGIYARSDARVGVHKAPANEVVEDALNLSLAISDGEQAKLNEAGINCLRSFAGRGIRVWGARTLSGQPDWLYVNVRRLFLTLTRWLRQNMNDLVFETNNALLWEHVRRRIAAYCRDLFERGALMGSSPAQAFFVKCDAETNTLESRDAGLVVAEVGLAVVVPAEFIVVRITQRAGMVMATGLTVS